MYVCMYACIQICMYVGATLMLQKEQAIIPQILQPITNPMANIGEVLCFFVFFVCLVCCCVLFVCFLFCC